MNLQDRVRALVAIRDLAKELQDGWSTAAAEEVVKELRKLRDACKIRVNKKLTSIPNKQAERDDWCKKILEFYNDRRTDIQDEGRAIEADRGKPTKVTEINHEHSPHRVDDPERAAPDATAVRAHIDTCLAEVRNIRDDMVKKEKGQALVSKANELSDKLSDLARKKVNAKTMSAAEDLRNQAKALASGRNS